MGPCPTPTRLGTLGPAALLPQGLCLHGSGPWGLKVLPTPFRSPHHPCEAPLCKLKSYFIQPLCPRRVPGVPIPRGPAQPSALSLQPAVLT